MKTTKQIIEEFRKLAYPIVHSNTFPEKDGIYLKELENFFRQALSQQRNDIIKEIEEALPKEWEEEPKRNIIRRSHIEIHNKTILEIKQAIKKVADKN